MDKGIVRRMGPVVRAFAVMVITAVMMAGSGCGSSSESGSLPDDGFSLEAGGEVSVSGPGDEATVTDAVLGEDVFSAADLPLEEGRKLEFAANKPGVSTQVIFNLEGPWKFTSGAEEATLTVSMEPKVNGFSYESFPDAQVVAVSSWSPAPDLVEYNFQSKDDDGWTAYGRSDEDGRVVSYANTSRAMSFSMAVGDSWVDSYTELENGRSIDVTTESTVLAKNRLTVPAGSYDAFLLQSKVTAKPRGRQETTTLDYTWFVPGIGRAAEIISLPDERREIFSTASAFYRLTSYR